MIVTRKDNKYIFPDDIVCRKIKSSSFLFWKTREICTLDFLMDFVGLILKDREEKNDMFFPYLISVTKEQYDDIVEAMIERFKFKEIKKDEIEFCGISIEYREDNEKKGALK